MKVTVTAFLFAERNMKVDHGLRAREKVQRHRRMIKNGG